MGNEGEHGDRSTGQYADRTPGPSDQLPDSPLAELVESPQTPLYYAEHAARYARQNLITAYEDEFDCRLVVMVDAIFGESVTYFEELVHDADPSKDLHLILHSPGGDGETAVRLARSAQARCRRFTVIVPDEAKSAGTILALGAHRIVMGPASDLGPVDPQLQIPRGNRWELVAAKDLIAAVEAAETAVQNKPDTYPIHAALLADVTEIMLQQARAALERTADLMEEALKSQPDRSPSDVENLKRDLKEPLIARPQHHGAIFGADDASAAGLPVIKIDPASLQWQAVWRLWSKYFILNSRIYEGHRASRIMDGGFFR